MTFTLVTLIYSVFELVGDVSSSCHRRRRRWRWFLLLLRWVGWQIRLFPNQAFPQGLGSSRGPDPGEFFNFWGFLLRFEMVCVG